MVRGLMAKSEEVINDLLKQIAPIDLGQILSIAIDVSLESICDEVRADLKRELEVNGATQEGTMAVQAWLKQKGLWNGEDF